VRHDTVMLRELVARKRWDPRAHLRSSIRSMQSSSGSSVHVISLARERREQSRPPTDPAEQFVYIGLENVESGTGDIVGSPWRKGGDVLSTSKHFRTGDVLLSRLRPNLNKVCCPPFSEGFCSGEFIVLAPNTERVSSRVLRELLASPDFVQRLTSLVAGATLPRVAAADVLQQDVPAVDPAKLQALTASLQAEDKRRQQWKEELAEQPSRLIALVTKHCV